MDPTKEANQNHNQNDDVACGEGHVASEETLHENGENPNQNDIASTSNPPPAKRANIIDLNSVYVDLDDNDNNSKVVEEASNVIEHPEVTEPVSDNVNQHPESTEFNLDIDEENEPKDVIQISDSDSDITQTDDHQYQPKTYNLFKTEADNSLAHFPSGIVPFMPSGHDTGESSSAGTKKRKFTDGLVKEEEYDGFI